MCAEGAGGAGFPHHAHHKHVDCRTLRVPHSTGELDSSQPRNLKGINWVQPCLEWHCRKELKSLQQALFRQAFLF